MVVVVTSATAGSPTTGLRVPEVAVRIVSGSCGTSLREVRRLMVLRVVHFTLLFVYHRNFVIRYH